MVGINQVKLSFKGAEVNPVDNQDNNINTQIQVNPETTEPKEKEKSKRKAGLLIAGLTTIVGIAALIYMEVREKRSLQRSADEINKVKRESDAYFDNLLKPQREEKAKLKKYSEDFQHAVKSKPIETIKQEIKAEIPDFDFENTPLSENIINAFSNKHSTINPTGGNYSEELLQNLYAFVKRKQPEITDEKEAERCRQFGVYLLSKLRTSILNEGTLNGKTSGFVIGQAKIIDEELSREADSLLNHYFGVDGLPKATRDDIKNRLKFCEYYPHPTSAFINVLQEVIEQNLKNVKLNHVKGDKISTEGLNILELTEKINNKAKEIYGTNDIYDNVTNYYFLKASRTIDDYKKGNFYEEYSGGSVPIKNERVAALKVFKEFGEDLGDDPDKIDPATLKKAYIRLCKKHHPDNNPQTAEQANEIMKKINVAFDNLKKPK